MLGKWSRKLGPSRLIALSFVILILTGTFLLCLPVSARDGNFTSPLDALFTATSATCVTGLIVADTFTKWSLFGQIVILILIQIGGIGLMSFISMFFIFMKRKLSLQERMLLMQAAGNTQLSGMVKLVRRIVSGTFLIEGCGALLLALRFIPRMGFGQGLYYAVFHAISAFCNAGFDILGFEKPDNSLIGYANDPLVCIPVALLIIVGGLGFIVIHNIYYAKLFPSLKKKKRLPLNLHSRVAICMTVALLVIGTVGFLAFEWNNTLEGKNFFQKLLVSFFQSTSARTAGFASVDIASEHDITKLLTVILMFIGAAPAGTGGGIKVTTFVVLVATVVSVMFGKEDTTLNHRRIEKGTVYRALSITTVSMLVVFFATGVILATNDHPISAIDALFEATSAFGTVGLTASLTPTLNWISKFVLSLTMFIGRVGPISLALAIAIKRARNKGAILPEGKIVVG